MVKLLLIFLIITLIIGIFSVFSRSDEHSRGAKKNNDKPNESRHVSKSTGEYVDFEDLGKEK